MELDFSHPGATRDEPVPWTSTASELLVLEGVCLEQPFGMECQPAPDNEEELYLVLDGSLEVTFVNGALERWLGGSSDTLLGQSGLQRLPLELASILQFRAPELLRRPNSVRFTLSVGVGPLARQLEWTLTSVPTGSGQIDRLCLSGHDITDRIRDRARDARLQILTMRLASTLSQQEVAEVLVKQVHEYLRATSSLVYFVSEQDATAYLVASEGVSRAALEPYKQFPLDSPLPLPQAIRSGFPEWYDSRETLESSFPDLMRARSPTVALEGIAVVPLRFDKRVMGCMSFTFSEPHSLDATTRRFLKILAAQGAQALDRARLYEDERRARAAAEAAEHETHLIYQLTDRASRAQHMTDIFEPAFDALEKLLDLAGAAVLLAADDGALRVQAGRNFPETLHSALEAFGPWSADQLATLTTPSDARMEDHHGPWCDFLTGEPIRGLLIMPLSFGDQTLGTLVLMSDVPRTFTTRELKLARTIADQVAITVGRIRAETALRVSEARYRLATLATSDAIWDWDIPNQLVYWNDAVLPLFGYPRAEVSTDLAWWSEKIHPDDQQEVLAGIHHAVDSGARTWRTGYRFRRHDGSYAHVIDRGYIVHDSSRCAIRMVGAMEDISEQKLATEFRERIIGIVSHDLRNPLNAVSISAGLLLKRGHLDAQQRTTVERILSSAERANRMIRDLLDFTLARLGGGLPVTPKLLELHGLAQQIVDEAHVASPNRTIVLMCEGDTSGVWDQDRIAQVITNLVSNALRYSPPGTPIWIETRGESDEVRLSIHNKGEAIQNDLLPRLFEPMQRGDSAEGAAGGLGLGLYIVDQIVRAHRGRVEVHSTGLDGTTFIVSLPRLSTREGV